MVIIVYFIGLGFFQANAIQFGLDQLLEAGLDQLLEAPTPKLITELRML